MKNGFKLMYQKDLSAEEKESAIKKLQWFVKTSFNPERYVEKKGWVPMVNEALPCWRQLTRGGHPNGMPLQRGKWGHQFEGTLLFRRHGKNRVFVVQRTETVDVKEGSDVTNNCPCGQCLGGRKAKSLLSLEGDFETYATIGNWKG